MADMAKVISFLEGFEDDELQEGMPELIAAAKRADEVLRNIIASSDAGDHGSLMNAILDAKKLVADLTHSDEQKCPDCNGLGAFPETGLDCGRCYGGGTIKTEGQ